MVRRGGGGDGRSFAGADEDFGESEQRDGAETTESFENKVRHTSTP